MSQRAPLIGAVVAVLLAVAFWFLLYTPADEEQAELEQETVQLQQQQQQLRNTIAQLREIQANEVEIRAALARLEDYIPSGLAQPTAIRQFQQSADAAGVDILAVSFAVPEAVAGAPSTGQEDTVLGFAGVTMTVDGGYFQMVDFLRRLEVDVPRATLVTSVAVVESTEAAFPLLSTTWTGRLFAIIPPPEGTIPEEPPPPAEGEEAPAEGEGS